MSFAFLLSTFVYIYIFYTFNLSLSTLFNTTKFWFFISNTLILIIAVDYGAFSSSKEKHDLYEDDMMHSQVKNNVSSFVSQYPDVAKETTPEREVDDLQEKKVIAQESDLFPESNSQVVTNSDLKKPIHREDWQEKTQVLIPHADKIHAKPAVIDESKNIPRRSENEKHEPSEEENEFSTMSDEELNRRVEEFIKRFNRQIRLQATRNSSEI